MEIDAKKCHGLPVLWWRPVANDEGTLSLPKGPKRR